MSIAATIKLDDFKPLNDLIDRFVGLDTHELLAVLGSVGESQTHHRIQNEKETPEGKSWREWSDDYKDTRHTGHSLLMNEGELDDSIQFDVSNDQFELGSNLDWAATHNFGDDKRGIAARTYLGFSDDNEQEFEDTIETWMQNVLRD